MWILATMTPIKGQPTTSANFRLTETDRENAQRIIRAGWANNVTQAIRFALKYAASEKT